MPTPNEIREAVQGFLSRFSPPRNLAGNTTAMADEALAICAAVTRFAPASGFDGWWRDVATEITRSMKTRAWPLVGEVEAACRAVTARNAAFGGADDAIEMAAVDRMAGWYRRFRTQMPGHGRPSRTMALIRAGVLADVREARFRGFALHDDQMRAADDMPMGHAEADHHAAVMDSLAALSRRVSGHRQEVEALRRTVKPTADLED